MEGLLQSDCAVQQGSVPFALSRNFLPNKRRKRLNVSGGYCYMIGTAKSSNLASPFSVHRNLASPSQYMAICSGGG
eukprot:CAMPEP_0196665628 /NCGR_PEP_ID=MMETSP1086-20130531/61871_1 /TAXON_ID=77921 /ORGANISM="Cyanoptyche  gloeocystis , Strain SAG4.97" /LENGTH=75 /DNA_ID=CAMNT_0042002483 /DNA_START=703 /DNA_END=930 /DNA_ORIENTATION=-